MITILLGLLFCTCVLTLYFSLISIQCIGVPVEKRRDPEFLDVKLRNYVDYEIEVVQNELCNC